MYREIIITRRGLDYRGQTAGSRRVLCHIRPVCFSRTVAIAAIRVRKTYFFHFCACHLPRQFSNAVKQTDLFYLAIREGSRDDAGDIHAG